MGRTCGFTLIELMIILVIIAILVALAIPGLQNARKSANEARMIGICNTTVTLSAQYRARFGSYPRDEIDLIDSGMMPDYPATGWFPAYDITYIGSQYAWSLTASPALPGVSGDRSFYVDHTGVIRYEHSTPATSVSPPLD